MWIRILLAAVMLTMAASSEAKTCSLSSADQKVVQSLATQYRDAWLSTNAEAGVMALMSDSATILPHHGVKPSSGHQQIRAFWFPSNMASFQLLQLTMEPINVDGCGDVAYVWGNQSVEWKIKDNPKITSNAGTFLLVARKHDKKWLIERLMWDDPPNQTR